MVPGQRVQLPFITINQRWAFESFDREEGTDDYWRKYGCLIFSLAEGGQEEKPRMFLPKIGFRTPDSRRKGLGWNSL